MVQPSTNAEARARNSGTQKGADYQKRLREDHEQPT